MTRGICQCTNPYEDERVSVTFPVTTDDAGMVILRSVADGDTMTEHWLCRHEAFKVAWRLVKNAVKLSLRKMVHR
jgi:hypothetical protein